MQGQNAYKKGGNPMADQTSSSTEATSAIMAQLNSFAPDEQMNILQAVSKELQLDVKATSPARLPTQAYGPPSTTVGSATPDKTVINYVWTAIITGFLIVFVGSAAGLVVALFMFHGIDPLTKQPVNNSDIVQPLITLFTAATGFLAGVLTPSPVQPNQVPPNQRQ